MAFKSNDLSVLAYANGFTLWHYATADTAATVGAVNYFNDSAHMIRVGDMIMANVDTDGSPSAGVFLVNQNNGGQVDVANLTVFGGSDTA